MSEVLPRRTRGLRWEPLTVGIDVGGTKVLGAVVDSTGTVIALDRRPTEGQDVRKVEDTIVDLVTGFGQQYDVAAVGIGAAGFVDVTRTVVMFSPHLDWRREPLRARVAERLRLPVVVDNDANTAALAECRFGAGRGHRFVLCVTLGTGIGGALVLDSRVYRGANGMAGEFGHIQVVPQGHWCECGNRGCWEQYASGNALVRDARALVRSSSPMAHHLRSLVDGDADALEGPQVTQAARDGDPVSIELTRQAFSRSLTGRGHRNEPVITQASLGPNAGFIGAADMARSAARRSRRGRVRRSRAGRPRRRLFERAGLTGTE
jgi:glucokinase